jgi:hypothetical protein
MENRNKYWTFEEEQILMYLYKDKKPINEISKILKRSSFAINSRLIKLNINNDSSNNQEILEEIKDELKEIKNELKRLSFIIENNNTQHNNANYSWV